MIGNLNGNDKYFKGRKTCNQFEIKDIGIGLKWIKD